MSTGVLTIAQIKALNATAIAAKAVATPNPALVSAADHAALNDHILNYLANQTPPIIPAGVKFTTTPATPTVSVPPADPSISVGSSVVDVSGTSKTVAAQNLPFTLAATGKIRLDAIVVNYLATPAVYELISGTEVASTATAIRPPIPANRLFLTDVDVTDGIATPKGGTGGGTTYIFDSTPTAGSTNPVESQGIKTYVDGRVANDIDYTPAESNNTTGFFAGLVATGKLKIKAALDAIVTTVKTHTTAIGTATLTTTAQNLKAAVNEVNAKPTGITLRKRTAEITANFTLTQAESDAADLFIVNTASSIIITLPINLEGRQAVFFQKGVGTFTLQGGSGVTNLYQFENKFTSAGQKATVGVQALSNTDWNITGQTKL